MMRELCVAFVTLVVTFFCARADELFLPSARISFTPEQGTNAWTNVRDLVRDYSPRDATTPGAALAARWIMSRVAAHGLTVEEDAFTAETPLGKKKFCNVLATLRGTGDAWIVVLSHFDTMPGIGGTFTGANDSGSSTGLLIEFARSLIRTANSHARFYNVMLAFMDGEECIHFYAPNDGFFGSRYLARRMKKEGRRIKAVIGVDMIGDRDLKITVPRNGSRELRVLALQAADAAGIRSHVGLLDSLVYDDHEQFREIGYPAVNLIDFEFGSAPGLNDYWHTPADTLDKISPESLTIAGRLVAEMINILERQHYAKHGRNGAR